MAVSARHTNDRNQRPGDGWAPLITDPTADPTAGRIAGRIAAPIARRITALLRPLRHATRSVLLCAAYTILLLSSSLTRAQTVQDVRVPMHYTDAAGQPVNTLLAATEYRPRGVGPFPLVLINHGMPRSSAERAAVTGRYQAQALEFVRRGFLVINPVRRGYGATGGPFVEGNLSCAAPRYYESGLESARDLEAVIDWARTRNDIDTRRILLVGQSAGGFAALATASLQVEGVRGVISFAGGRGSRGPHDVCAEDRLVDAIGHFGDTTRVPTLWVYAENDLYFGPALVSRMAAAWRAAGGLVEVLMQPAWGDDGHAFFSATANVPVWSAMLDGFLAKAGLSEGPVAMAPGNAPVANPAPGMAAGVMAATLAAAAAAQLQRPMTTVAIPGLMLPAPRSTTR